MARATAALAPRKRVPGVRSRKLSTRSSLSPSQAKGILFRMNVAVEIPDEVSASLQSKWRDVPRRVLEATAAEAYRTGALTSHQVGQLLGHTSRWEAEAFLKRVQAYLHYSEADLERDLATLREVRGR